MLRVPDQPKAGNVGSGVWLERKCNIESFGIQQSQAVEKCLLRFGREHFRFVRQ